MPLNRMKYKVLDIIRGTTVDGPGFRTSIYLAGCSHHCPGCQNPQSWDIDNGRAMSLEEILKVIEEEDFDVTLSGGDPLFNVDAAKSLIKAIKSQNRNVWLYTGYTWEEIISDKEILEAVSNVDVIVDGRYIEVFRDPDLPFRGSTNQRIIDVAASIQKSEIILVQRD